MAGFKASKRLSFLDYDFEEFAPEHLQPLAGRIPEPSRAMVIDFNEAMSSGAESIGYEFDDPTDREEVIRVYARMKTEELFKIEDHVLDAIAEVTQNNPDRSHMEQCGNRAQMAFREWLMRELNNPEAPGGGTKK